MHPGTKALRLFSLWSAALGLLSISLTGEIAMPWLGASWAAFAFSWMADRYPSFLAQMKRLETMAVIVMIAMLFLDFLVLRFSVFIAITHFLMLFQIVKLLGEKTRKDCFQIFLFSFFQILASCTLSVDAWHAAILLALIPAATATLFWNQIDSEWERAGGSSSSEPHRHYRRMAIAICLVAVPLNLLLTLGVFVLFPRLTVNASLPGFGGQHAGYTDQMNLAQKGRLQQNSTVVLWMSFPKPQERAAWNGLLRGEILSHFDGRQWRPSKEAPAKIIAPDSNGIFFIRPPKVGAPVIHQSMTIAETSAATLFAISRPIRARAPLPALQESNEGSLRWLVPWNRPLRYEVVSEIVPDLEVSAADLQLPKMDLRRVGDLAKQISGRGTPLQQASRIEHYLQTTYHYSMDFGDRVPENPVDYFLFERREGACGHFASAMAVLLRLRHIPSRVVAGYFKGEWNQPSQSVVIRERDAHAWVEVYIDQQGWMTFDPTPLQASAGAFHKTWYSIFEIYWVYLDLLWNRFVIQYDLYSQIKLFETLKGASNSWSWNHRERPSTTSGADVSTTTRRPFALTPIALFIFLMIASALLLKRRRMSYDSTIQFYSQFLKQMERAGCAKQHWETGQEFAARIESGRPDEGAMARAVTERYYRIRFGGTSV